MDKVTQFLMNHKMDTLKLGIVLSVNTLLIKKFIERRKFISQKEKIKKESIYTIQDSLKRAKLYYKNKTESKKTFQCLIKVQPYVDFNNKVPSISVTQEIHSNQIHLIEPSLTYIGYKIVSLVNSSVVGRNYKAQQKLNKLHISQNYSSFRWKAKLRQKNKIIPKQIKGLGFIHNSTIFQIKTEYNPMINKGFLKTLYEKLAYYAQKWFFTSDKYKSIHENRLPNLMGPVIGKINYIFNLVINKSLILKAEISENGEIKSLFSAVSRQDIIQFLQDNIIQVNAQIFFLLGICLFINVGFSRKLRFMLKKAKKIIVGYGNELLLREVKLEKIQQRMILPEQKVCVICYERIRNIIFLNCRHMIVCQQCKANSRQQSCPICKAPVQDQKVIYQI